LAARVAGRRVLMGCSIGILATHHIWVGKVEGLSLSAALLYPQPGEGPIDLKSVPADGIIASILDQIDRLRQGATVDCVGAGFPGIVRNGIIDDSPNLGQLKGLRIQDRLCAALKAKGLDVPVTVVNDADAWLPESPSPAEISNPWCACGTWATESASACIRSGKAFGKAAIRW
jgi:hypothetical protein